MNNNDIYSIDFTRSLPTALKNDPKMIALAKTIAEQLQINARLIEKNIIYARIDELEEQMLDILAYDLHIDWYEYSDPIEIKRATIKDSVKVHRKLGTKYAVETAIGAVFPGTKVEEWFDYGGDPYRFRISIDATGGISEESQKEIEKRIKFYKNLRSWLDMIQYQMHNQAKFFIGANATIGSILRIHPLERSV